VFAAALCLAQAGCGEKERFRFNDIGLVTTHEELLEVPMGRFKVPVPVVERGQGKAPSAHNRMQIGFQLFALVSPSEVASLTESLERHEGKIRDNVIRVCRNATMSDLEEPELTTLKAHLTDAMEIELGASGIRRLLITDVISEEI
jgi:hypothetical protein